MIWCIVRRTIQNNMKRAVRTGLPTDWKVISLFQMVCKNQVRYQPSIDDMSLGIFKTHVVSVKIWLIPIQIGSSETRILKLTIKASFGTLNLHVSPFSLGITLILIRFLTLSHTFLCESSWSVISGNQDIDLNKGGIRTQHMMEFHSNLREHLAFIYVLSSFYTKIKRD